MIKTSVLTSLYKCENYLNDFFLNVNSLTNLDDVEFIFIHNDPTYIEKEIIFNNLNGNKNINYQYIEVEREPLYKSWNRGIIKSKGEFIAVWNVDDVRYIDSLKLQQDTLLENISAVLTYGNFEIETGSGIMKIEVADALNSIGLQKFQNGSFIMWRKSIHEIIGYFDEQLFIIGDMDFWYRVTSEFLIVKTNANIGKFLFTVNSALSSNSTRNSIERCLIIKRYGFWSPINILNMNKVRSNYDFRHMYYLNKKVDLKTIRKPITIYFFKTAFKSLALTLLFIINPKHKRFVLRNF